MVDIATIHPIINIWTNIKEYRKIKLVQNDEDEEEEEVLLVEELKSFRVQLGTLAIGKWLRK